MWIVDIPYVPTQEVPVMMAQVSLSQSKIAPKQEEALEGCQDVTSAFDHSAWNSLPVLQGVLGRLGYQWDDATNNFNAPSEIIAGVKDSKVAIVEAPQHGTVGRLSPNSYFWQYTAEPGYIGQDKVVFLVEYEGRAFRITVNLLVHKIVPEGPDDWEDYKNYTPPCQHVFPPST